MTRTASHRRWLLTAILCSSAVSAALCEPIPWSVAGATRRVAVTVSAAAGAETDFPVQIPLDAAALLGKEAFNPATLRVVECDPVSGKPLRTVPALYLPSDASRGTPGGSPWPPPYPAGAAPVARASSESPQTPAANVADTRVMFKPTTWEPSAPDGPWTVALDFGKPVWINSLWSVYPGHSSTMHCPYAARFEVSADTTDGLAAGTWEKVGGWDGDNGRIPGQYRAAWFAPRRIRAARLVVTQSTGTPWIDDFRALAPALDPEVRAAGTVHWVAGGRTEPGRPRLFTIYFGGTAGGEPSPPVGRIGILREGEDSVYSIHGIGFGSAVRAEKNASGGRILSCPAWTMSHASLVACFPVTIPFSGKWSLHLRVRGNLREHPIRVLLDNAVHFNGTFTTEGPEWTALSLPPARVDAGTRYLEIYLTDTLNEPLELDYVLLTSDPKFLPGDYLKVEAAGAEVRP